MKRILTYATMLTVICFLMIGFSLAAPKSDEEAKKKEVTSSETKETSSKSKDTSRTSKSKTVTDTDSQKTTPTKTGSATAIAPSADTNQPSKSLNPEIPTLDVKTGETIAWSAFTSGGGLSASTSFSLLSAVGQPAVGASSSTNFSLNSGFVQIFEPATCCLLAGNANGSLDGKVNISDITFLIKRIFGGGPPPPCCAEANANGSLDGKVNISDITFLIKRIFGGGPAPVCGPANISC